MRILLLILSVAIICVGCGSLGYHHQSRWYKPGVSSDQVAKDFRECEMYGKAHSNMNPFMAVELTHDCMLNKGYNKQ
jgi:hypothetical protein